MRWPREWGSGERAAEAGVSGFVDLKNPKLIYAKGFMFGAILLVSCAVIVLWTRDWGVAGMLGLVIWSSARGYYFMFYVIEKYVDPRYRFAGVFDFVMYLFRGSSRG